MTIPGFNAEHALRRVETQYRGASVRRPAASTLQPSQLGCDWACVLNCVQARGCNALPPPYNQQCASVCLAQCCSLVGWR